MVVLIEMTPKVARLVIITENAGNSCAELFFKPISLICLPEHSMNIDRAAVRSVGEYQFMVPLSQYS